MRFTPGSLIGVALMCAATTAFGATAPPPPPTSPATTPAVATVKRGGITGLEVMTGTVFQENQSSFSGIALRMCVRNAALVPSLEFMPTVEYWQNTSHLDAFGIETRRRDATLGLDARWVFANKSWRPYAGTGFSLHFLDDELRAPRYGTPHGSSGVVKGGIDALVGAEFGMGARLGSFVELKLLNVTRYRQVKFNTGLGWNL